MLYILRPLPIVKTAPPPSHVMADGEIPYERDYDIFN